MMDSSFVEKIVELAQVDRFEIEGLEYASKGLVLIKPPLVAAIKVGTMTGLADYLKDNPDLLTLNKLIVQVVSPTVVSLVRAQPDDYGQREEYIKATVTPRTYPFGQYQDVEEFIIAMQTYFVGSDMTRELVGLVSAIQDDGSVSYVDNGMSQQVTAKTGIVAIGNVKVPNPVKLAPYRTFLEVDQPESLFVFRIKKAQGGAPACALFLADGGSWELEAVKRVRDWLRANIPEGMTILA